MAESGQADYYHESAEIQEDDTALSTLIDEFSLRFLREYEVSIRTWLVDNVISSVPSGLGLPGSPPDVGVLARFDGSF